MKKAISVDRGIVLITTLMITAFLVMIASAMMISTMRQQLIAGRYYQKEQALMAAETGINYAMMRLSQSQDTDWEGSETGEDYRLTEPGEIEIYEWVVGDEVNSTRGVIEGKIYHNGTNSTFDMYFVDPSTAISKMQFYNTTTNPIPDKIPLCLNNYGVTSIDTYSYYSDGSTYKTIPAGYILLVCRGKCGDETRIVETCVTLEPGGQYDATISAGGNLRFKLDKYGDMNLSSDTLMRANGNIIVNSDEDNTDWLSWEGSESCGKANGTVTLNPTPSGYERAFVSDAGDQSEHIPSLEWDDVEEKATSSGQDFTSVNAGIYVLEPSSGSTPTVTYYATDSEDDLESCTGNTSNSLTSLIKTETLCGIATPIPWLSPNLWKWEAPLPRRELVTTVIQR